MKFSSVAPLLAILGPAAAGVLAEKRQDDYPIARFYSEPNFGGLDSEVVYDQECIPLTNDLTQAPIRNAAKSIQLLPVPEGKPNDYWTCGLYNSLTCSDGAGPQKYIRGDDTDHQNKIFDDGETPFSIETFKCWQTNGDSE